MAAATLTAQASFTSRWMTEGPGAPCAQATSRTFVARLIDRLPKRALCLDAIKNRSCEPLRRLNARVPGRRPACEIIAQRGDGIQSHLPDALDGRLVALRKQAETIKGIGHIGPFRQWRCSRAIPARSGLREQVEEP